MDTAAYLRRIDDAGPREPTLATLRRLHGAHLRSVPFENLDIHLGRPIVVDEAGFFRKIVEGRRGGFCYELNGLFAGLLRRLGFHVTLLSARVVTGQDQAGPEFDHLALEVALPGGCWLADVGFGRSFHEPLSLDAAAESEAEGRRYRVVSGDPCWRLEHRIGDGAPEPEYLFTRTARRLEEFAGMCAFHQSSPGSPFPRKRLCTLATAGGRITFLNGDFIEEHEATRTQRALAEGEVGPLLRERFGLPLSDQDVAGWSRPVQVAAHAAPA